MKISICDTSICDDNLGNEIIMDSVYKIINEVFTNSFFIKLQYLENYNDFSKRHLKESKYVIFGGTNALTSNMNKYSQMGFKFKDTFYFKNLVLMGVGWWQYQNPPNLYTKLFLNRLLHSNIIHSVRDNYTKNYLNKIGIKNVVNTCCPSLWTIDHNALYEKSKFKSSDVITTITDYNKNQDAEKSFLNLLSKNYKHCYLWLQGAGDKDYFNSLNLKLKNVTLIPPKLSALDEVLMKENVDYIGTRLHAGIRAMQKNKKALILSIDNRAIEIGKDIALSVCNRENLNYIKQFIDCKEIPPKLKIPFKEIKVWKEQFKT